MAIRKPSAMRFIVELNDEDAARLKEMEKVTGAARLSVIRGLIRGVQPHSLRVEKMVLISTKSKSAEPWQGVHGAFAV